MFKPQFKSPKPPLKVLDLLRLGRLAPGPPALLGEEDGLDVRQHPALGDCHAGQQLVQLLVVPE